MSRVNLCRLTAVANTAILTDSCPVYFLPNPAIGSEITTRGLQRAFEALDRVQICQVLKS